MTFPNRVHVEPARAQAVSGAGHAWAHPDRAVDGDDSTYAYIYHLLSGEDSEVLTMTGFDLTWFDSSALDMVGVTLLLKTRDIEATKATFAQIQLVDETGATFGPDVAASYPYPSSSGEWQAIDIAVNIPQATYSSAAFGVRIQLTNTTGAYIPRPGIYACEIIPKFERKQLPTTNYGARLFDAAGAEKLTLASTIVRLVDVQHVAGGFTGTISIPDFDDTKGVLFFVPEFTKFRADTDTQEAAATAWSSSNYLYLRGHSMELPTADWDNTAKELTVATGGNYPLPSGFEGRGDMTLGWAVIAVHYR